MTLELDSSCLYYLELLQLCGSFEGTKNTKFLMLEQTK